MTSPVQLSDLDPTSVANDADLALIRKNNTTDYKVTVQVLRNINVGGLPDLSTTANSPDNTDLLIVARAGVNCKCLFPAIGLPKGTKLWFYQDAVPVSTAYWAIVPNTGDRLLAVKGGSSYTVGGTVTNLSNWQQLDATLTIEQIPAHAHVARVRKNKSSTLDSLFAGTQPTDSQNNATTGYTGGTGSTDKRSTDPVGATKGHNHGNTWRPSAAVGILCQKQK